MNLFATNACNLPKYALEHVWECFWAFGSGTKNDAKRVHFGTRMHCCRVTKLGSVDRRRGHESIPKMHSNLFGSDFGHSVPARKMMQNGCISAPDCTIGG